MTAGLIGPRRRLCHGSPMAKQPLVQGLACPSFDQLQLLRQTTSRQIVVTTRRWASAPTCLPRSGSWRRSAALPKDDMTEPWRVVAVLAWRMGRRRRWPQTTGPASSTHWKGWSPPLTGSATWTRTACWLRSGSRPRPWGAGDECVDQQWSRWRRGASFAPEQPDKLRLWGSVGSLGLSMQESGGWANLPATTRPLQRVQPETAQASITHGQPGPGWPVGPLVSAGRADGVH
jgi:hypothetical protein